MATSVQGNGIYWAIGNLVHNLSGTFYHNSVDLNSNVEVKRIKGSDGRTQTAVYVDQIDELTFESVPIGAAGITNATVTLPAFGTKVTITGGRASSLATATWIVEPPLGLTFGNDSEAKFKCKLTRYEAITPA